MSPDKEDLAYAWDCWTAMRDALEFLEGKTENDFRSDKQLRFALGARPESPLTKSRMGLEAGDVHRLC